MSKKKFLWGTCLILSGIASIQIANAKPSYPAAAPATYHQGGTLSGGNGISCSTCHWGPASEGNVITSFGVAFKARSNDDIGGSLLTAYNALAPFDSDGDGFSNQQEAYAGSALNEDQITPSLIPADKTATGVQAQATVGGPVDLLSLDPAAPTGVVGLLGGMVDFGAKASTTGNVSAKFFFKAGAAQSSAVTAPTILFYNKDNTTAPIDTAKCIAGADYLDGSVTVTVTDDSVCDFYTTANLQADAVAKYNNNNSTLPFASTLTINPYATVDPYAIISPTAIIDDYAVIDAYAVVDDYAVVGPYAQVRSYAYIAPKVKLYPAGSINAYAQVDRYAQVTADVTTPGLIPGPNGTGYVEAKFAVTSVTPPTKLISGKINSIGAPSSGGGTSTTPGLHCMTTGLGTQGLMFLGLLGTVFLVRRKLN